MVDSSGNFLLSETLERIPLISLELKTQLRWSRGRMPNADCRISVLLFSVAAQQLRSSVACVNYCSDLRGRFVREIG